MQTGFVAADPDTERALAVDRKSRIERDMIG